MIVNEDRKKAIEYIVNGVFYTEYKKEFAVFLAQYDNHVRQTIRMSMSIGEPIALPPIKFDMSQCMDHLINNLVAVDSLFTEKETPQHDTKK